MSSHRSLSSPTVVALGGLLSLAVSMGVGRFAFTPVLPLMVGEGLLTVAQGSWLAAANYAGYLLGALLAARLAVDMRRLAILSLGLVACSTAAMAMPGGVAWTVLRFSSGLLAAWVFVATSVWCLATLARMNRPDLGGCVYAGVGVGIAAAGVCCLWMAVQGLATPLIWISLGLLALAMTIPVALVIRLPIIVSEVAPSSSSDAGRVPAGTGGLVVSYGIMGYGYILPATFLPLLARSVITDPALFGLAWPVFGLTAALSTLFAGLLMRRYSRLRVWAVSQLLMGIGAVVPSIWSSGTSILLSAILVGGTFMVITLAGVQEVRERVAWSPAKWVGYLTAAFALGQIAGPMASYFLLLQPGLADEALGLGLQSAALLLFTSGIWLWRYARPIGASRGLQHVR